MTLPESADDARKDAGLHAMYADELLEDTPDDTEALAALARSGLAIASRLGQIGAHLANIDEASRSMSATLERISAQLSDRGSRQ